MYSFVKHCFTLRCSISGRGRCVGTDVAVLICTRDRLALLGDCIASLRAQACDPGSSTVLVIADNSEIGNEASIRSICSAIHYVHEPRRGYSNVRNAALDCALTETSADIFMFIDDDVIAAPDLVVRHMATLRRFHADVSFGVTENCQLKEGERPPRVATNNVAFRRTVAEANRFCSEANLIGCEDVEFFRDAEAKGARIVRSASARVFGNRNQGNDHEAVDMDLMGRASARNVIYLTRVRRGYLRACYRYIISYIPRLIRGSALRIAALAIGDGATAATARRNLALHQGALEGLFKPGVDRALAKQGRLVAVI